MHILDFPDDLGASLTLALQSREAPELLKTAEWKEPYEALDRDFALILVDDVGEHRKYACHDPGNTAVSMFYLVQAQNHLSPPAVKTAAANLARIGTEQGLPIPSGIQKLAELQVDDRDILDERRVIYRAPPPERRPHQKLAGYSLLAETQRTWLDKQPHEKRASALQLRAEGQEIAMELPQEIYAYTGEELSPKFASHMRMRAQSTANTDLSAEYSRLGKVASVLGPEESLKALYELDKLAGFYWGSGNRYGRNMADPFLCVYETEKTAMWSWSHGGDHINQAQLIAFANNPESARAVNLTFAGGMWEKLMKNPVGTFKSLPLEQQILLSRMARQG
jgi:hypothetical protein